MYTDASSDNNTDRQKKTCSKLKPAARKAGAEVITNVLGYPGIGDKRELKWAVESFWRGQSTKEELLNVAGEIKRKNWRMLKNTGIDLIPSNDFTLYDHMLDMSCMLGVIPDRFDWKGSIDLDLYFRIARGRSVAGKSDTKPCEMTKWFNTNYHYIVPEVDKNTDFRLSSTKIFDEFAEAKKIGILTKPVLVGPVTYLMLSKSYSAESFNTLQLLDKIVPVYATIIKRLNKLGAQWIQLDEPIFSLDLSDDIVGKLEYTYNILAKSSKSKLMVANYFGGLGSNLTTFVNLPVDAIHVDAVVAPNEVLKAVNVAAENGKMLSVGIVDGQNIWANDLAASKKLLSDIAAIIGKNNIIIGTSSSLEYVPISVEYEDGMDDKIKSWLSFAAEKVNELSILSKIMNDDIAYTDILARNRKIVKSRKDHFSVNNQAVRNRCSNITANDLRRNSPYIIREVKQHKIFKLPMLPTTTIGSFPQTKRIRKARSDFKKGGIDKEVYENFIKREIRKVVSIQEKIGLDVLVHGEAERSDMVEYFAGKLNGFLITRNGWVRSYGTRCVKPPIIYGDVSRICPMTVKWAKYVQSLTTKPAKGMLTGPNTMLQWSFVRNDQPLSQTATQIALAIRDEVLDLEEAGVKIIQIDEPALREGLPLRKSQWNRYFKWAINSFKLAANGVTDGTQIHTHICYSEFNDIIKFIADMDADVISIEASRSKMKLLNAFSDFEYPNEVGPGIYDVHSPRVPSADEMAILIKRALKVIPAKRLWINPDCGLKTRQWSDIIPSLKNMVTAAELCRDTLK